jgi:hypothetical protein
MSSTSDKTEDLPAFLEYDWKSGAFEWITQPIELPPDEQEYFKHISAQQEALADFQNRLSQDRKPEMSLDQYKKRMAEYLQLLRDEQTKAAKAGYRLKKFIVPPDLTILYYIFNQGLVRGEERQGNEWDEPTAVDEEPTESIMGSSSGPSSGSGSSRRPQSDSRSEKPHPPSSSRSSRPSRPKGGNSKPHASSPTSSPRPPRQNRRSSVDSSFLNYIART